MDREAIAVTAGDVYFLKWFDDRDQDRPAVRYELANRRDTAVPVRIEEVLPTEVAATDVETGAAFGEDWSFEQGTVTFEGTIPAGETLVSGYTIDPDSVGTLDALLVPPAITDRDNGETIISEGSSFKDVILKVPAERPDPIQPAIEELVAAMERRTERQSAAGETETETDAAEDELIESLIERRVDDPFVDAATDETAEGTAEPSAATDETSTDTEAAAGADDPLAPEESRMADTPAHSQSTAEEASTPTPDPEATREESERFADESETVDDSSPDAGTVTDDSPAESSSGPSVDRPQSGGADGSDPVATTTDDEPDRDPLAEPSASDDASEAGDDGEPLAGPAPDAETADEQRDPLAGPATVESEATPEEAPSADGVDADGEPSSETRVQPSESTADSDESSVESDSAATDADDPLSPPARSGSAAPSEEPPTDSAPDESTVETSDERPEESGPDEPEPMSDEAKPTPADDPLAGPSEADSAETDPEDTDSGADETGVAEPADVAGRSLAGEVAPANAGASEEPSNPFVDDPAHRSDDPDRADAESADRPAGGPGAPPKPTTTETDPETAADPLAPDTGPHVDTDSDHPVPTDDDGAKPADDRDPEGATADSEDADGGASGPDDAETEPEREPEPVEDDGEYGRPHHASGTRVDDVVAAAVPDPTAFDRGELVDDFQYTERTVSGVDPRDVARSLTTGIETIFADGRRKYTLDEEDSLRLESLPIGTRTGTVEGSIAAVGSWMAVGSETVDYGRNVTARAGVLAALGLISLSAGGLLVTDDGVAASMAEAAPVAAGSVSTYGGGGLAVLGLVLLVAGIVDYSRQPRGEQDRTYYYREVHRVNFDGPVSERVIQRDGDTITDLHGDLTVSIGTTIQVVVAEAGEQEVATLDALPKDVRSTLTTDHDLVVDGVE
jgi:hypothetical protein